MGNRPEQKQRKSRSFSPDEISTLIHQALRRDLSEAKQVYGFQDSPRDYAISRQSAELLKKYCSPDHDKAQLELEAFAKFRKINEHICGINERLINTLPIRGTQIQRGTPYMDKVHLRAQAIIKFVLGSFVEDEWIAGCKHSGGSTVGVPYVDTSVEKKFTFPMTVTKRALPFLKRCLDLDPQLRSAVEEFNRANPVTDWYRIVKGSQATTVDKDSTKRRFISTEPTGNMYLQQGTMECFYNRLKAVGLDLELLPMQHIRRAYLSSITCREATIDWASASDCEAIELVRWGLPGDWFGIVDAIRSPTTSIGDEEVVLGMVSTMGNANTFPIETLLFWAYAHAVRLSENPLTNALYPKWEDLLTVSVFGDDCIVPTVMAESYIAVMERIGFIVNDSKSFYGSEPFRESCGGDFLHGYDVRPYTIRAPQNTRLSSLEPWLYTIWNGILTKYISYFGELSYVYDKHVFRVMASLFRRFKLKIRLVPDNFTEDGGLKVSSDINRFARNYRVEFEPIARSSHGTYSFSYCRFQYREQYEQDDGLRYAMWLKKPPSINRSVHHIRVGRFLIPNTQLKPSKVISRRKIGGYVVAKALTCHWHVPEVKGAFLLKESRARKHKR